MSIKKLTLASLILIGLTACGSSGSGSGSNHKSPEQKITEQKQQLKDKADTAKVEAERLKKQAEKAKEKAESLAKEAEKAKTEAERLAQEKAEKAKAEAERLAKEAEKAKMEAERLAKEKVEKAKTEAERLAQEKAEKAKAEAERLAKEAEKAKTEAERLAKEEAEKAKAEAERLAQEKTKAEEAKKVEEAKKIVEAKGGFDNQEIGLKEFPVTEQDGKKVAGYLYNQKYSIVKAQIAEEDIRKDSLPTIDVKGLKTAADQLPKEGNAVYNGKAFNFAGASGLNGGDLVYNVDFAARTGSGRVNNMQDGYIDLKNGNISDSSISADAIRYHNNTEIGKGTYKVEFFGPKADEIGGKIDITQGQERATSFGISGTKAN